MKRPVMILSGFLGSGKTTLLNRLLKTDHGLRIALMINDFGDVNIDKDLVVGVDGEVMELSGGCMCCVVRDDLLSSAKDLLGSGRDFDYLIVETSGVADPASVAQTFLVPGLEEHFRLDAVVTVVDCLNVEATLAQSRTAWDQVRSADLLVVNKLDLVEPADMDRVKGVLAALNPNARMVPAINGIVPPALLLDIGGGHIAAKLPQEAKPGVFDRSGTKRGKLRSDATHDVAQSASIAEDFEIEYDRFDAFVQSLPDSVYRAKGVVAVRGFERRVIFHRVGYRNVLDQGEPWGDEPRVCRAVLLGTGFDGEELLARFRRCAAGSAQSGRSLAGAGIDHRVP